MKILIVDDSALFRTFFKNTLAQFSEVSYIHTASNGRQALQQVMLTDFDLILLDLEMPVMNGLETLIELKKRKFRGKIIICSGRTLVDYDAIQKVMKHGADGVISKSYQKGVSSSLSPDDFRNELIPRIFTTYDSKTKEHPKEIIQHSYDKECIDGILVIHLLDKNYEMLNYEYGSLEDGLDKVKDILNLAASTNTPLFIDDTIETLPNIKQVEQITSKYPSKLIYNMKNMHHANLALDWVHTNIKEFIEKNKIVNLLIVGFNRTYCVKNAAQQINKYYNINITICDELLFSRTTTHLQNSTIEKQKEHLEMFKEIYIFLESIEEVEDGLRKNKQIKKERLDNM